MPNIAEILDRTVATGQRVRAPARGAEALAHRIEEIHSQLRALLGAHALPDLEQARARADDVARLLHYADQLIADLHAVLLLHHVGRTPPTHPRPVPAASAREDANPRRLRPRGSRSRERRQARGAPPAPRRGSAFSATNLALATGSAGIGSSLLASGLLPVNPIVAGLTGLAVSVLSLIPILRQKHEERTNHPDDPHPGPRGEHP